MEEQQYKLLDGKAVSARMKQEMAEEVARIKAAGGKIPHLAAILVGHDGGSETYVASKVKTCNEIGFKSSLIRYEADVTEEELLRKVDELNNDPAAETHLGTEDYRGDRLPQGCGRFPSDQCRPYVYRPSLFRFGDSGRYPGTVETLRDPDSR